jgi:serpin B
MPPILAWRYQEEGKNMKKDLFQRISILMLTIVIITTASGCAQPVAYAEEVRSDLDRDSSPQVMETDLETLVTGNTSLAFDLYQALRQKDGNLFFSPHSISLALAMTYAGARGETERQMADTLHFMLSQERLHPAFNALDLELASRSEQVDEQEGEAFQLKIANSIWGQKGYTFLPEFLDLLAQDYGAGMNLVDFIEATEDARHTINQWVSDHTEEKIKDLIPQGAIDPLTRLVLANAIYFNAGWRYPFEEAQSFEDSFYLQDGSQVTATFMSLEKQLSYAQGEGYQALVLPYVGGSTAMVILLPDADQFGAIEASLNSEYVSQILGDLHWQTVHLKMPRFEYESSFGLRNVFSELGMPNAFQEADFSGIDGTKNLAITDILHKAFISVDEEGTEAAAATAVIIGLTSAPTESPIKLTLDHPFIFMIRDMETGTMLFLGRVMNPAK